MARFDLSDGEWAVIEPLLPKQARGPQRKDDRKVLNGVFYIPRHWRVAAGFSGALYGRAEGIGRSRGGGTSKVHAAVDAKGRPLRLEITGGHVHDSQVTEALLDWKAPARAIVADKAYPGAWLSPMKARARSFPPRAMHENRFPATPISIEGWRRALKSLAETSSP